MKGLAPGLLLLLLGGPSSSGFESARVVLRAPHAVVRPPPLATTAARPLAPAAPGFSRGTSVVAAIRPRRCGGRLPAVPAALAAAGERLLLPPAASRASRALRLASLLATVLLCASSRLRRRLLWPNLGPGPEATSANPRPGLLPGPLGCPFVGVPAIHLGGDEDYGGGNHYRTIARRLGRKLGRVPRIFKYYLLGAPFAVLSGGKTFQKVLGMEFGGSLTSAGAEIMEGGLLPTESLLFEPSRERHRYLRRLVGAALTPAAVARSAPLLQSAAELQVDKMLHVSQSDHGDAESGVDGPAPIRFRRACMDYALDVAWRQVLGLDLDDEEVPVFVENAAAFIEGVVSLQVVFKIRVEKTRGYAAKEYLVRKIRERIGYLRENGPDGRTTLSGMVFATDEEDPTRRLTDDEIVANALILIFAGSETAASTLTNAALFLGLHPGAWDRLAEEQATLRERFGDELSVSVLDEENAPYLNAVLKETLRMRVVVSGIPRKALRDIDVDGDGETIIPKGYMVAPSMMLTHEEDPNVKLPDAMHLDAIQGFRPGRWLGTPGDGAAPDGDWYVPYGFGPRYCLGRNLAQLEMKIFLATLARRIEFPRLAMLPDGYDYSPEKRDPSDPEYFSVRWAKSGSAIPVAGDGVLATVRARAAPSRGGGPDRLPSPPSEIADVVFNEAATETNSTQLVEA